MQVRKFYLASGGHETRVARSARGEVRLLGSKCWRLHTIVVSSRSLLETCVVFSAFAFKEMHKQVKGLGFCIQGFRGLGFRSLG